MQKSICDGLWAFNAGVVPDLGFYSLRTGDQGFNSHTLTEIGQLKIGKKMLLCFDLNDRVRIFPG